MAATFTYKAVDGGGIPSTGEIVGATKEAVTEELKRLLGPVGQGQADPAAAAAMTNGG